MLGVFAPRHIKNLDRKQLAFAIGSELYFTIPSFA
jgi:hypothetical protein